MAFLVGPDVAEFVAGALVSLAASAVLVRRIERLAGRLGISETLLGLTVALAADSPEITSAVTAAYHGQKTIGVGVVLGSNAFNLAALLGLGSIVAKRIALHRRVVLLEGSLAIFVAVVTILSVTVGIGAPIALALVVVAVGAYLVLSTASEPLLLRLGVGDRAVGWLRAAVHEEEEELSVAIGPLTRGRSDLAVALASIVAVVVASAAMERSASSVGAHFGVSEIVTGALVLAGVTSLPNAVAGVFLAKRGRGAALLSETMHSNTLNVLAGLFVPASFVGLARLSGQALAVAFSYGALTLLALGLSYAGRGLGRRAGTAVVVAYAGFVAFMLAR
ncbi:MAG: sodium:calcium antiporter [Acidimicrobiales bacterium]